jgi:hypothetical protein
MLAAYVIALVLLGREIGLWTSDLIAATVVWFVATAMVLFLKSTRVSEETGFMRHTFRHAVGAAVLVEGFVNLYVFPLPVELILEPTIFLLVATAAYAEATHKEEYGDALKLFNFMIASIGLAFLVYVVIHVLSDWSGSSLATDLRELALPVWLTVGLLPFIYLLGLGIAYEASFLRIELSPLGNARSRRRAKLALFLGVNIHARWLGGFGPPWPYRLADKPGLAEARAVVREFRLESAEAERQRRTLREAA